AINGDDLALRRFPQMTAPRDHELRELVRSEHREHSPERIVGRNSILQRRKLAKPVDPHFGKLFDFDPRITAGNRTTKGDEQDLVELVSGSIHHTRIWDFFQTCNYFKIAL